MMKWVWMPRMNRLAFLLALVVVFAPIEASAGLGIWTTNGPYGGPAYVVAVDPVKPTTLYEASPGAGVFKSTNSGASWKAVNTGLTDLTCLVLAIDPSNPETLYTAGGQTGVFKSVNGGTSWSLIGGAYLVTAIAIDPKTPTTLYLTTQYGGAEKSTDGGRTWVSLGNNGLTSDSVDSFAISPNNPSVVFAGDQAGVWKSTNAGASWTLNPKGPSYVNWIAIDPANPNTLYLTSDTEQGIFKSTDGGTTWVASGSGIGTYSDPGVLAIDPKKPDTLYASVGGPYGPDQVYISRNGGTKWAPLAAGLPKDFSVLVRSIAIDPKTSGTIYIGSDFGVSASTDGGTQWARRDAGLENMIVTAVAVNPKTPATVYAGTAYDGMYRSLDGGETWGRINSGLPGGFVQIGYTLPGITAIVIDPQAPKTLYISTSPTIHGNVSIYKSTDGGTTWKPGAGGVLDTSTNGYAFEITSLVMDQKNPSTLFAGTNQGVAMTVDGGAKWNFVNTGLPSYFEIDKLALADNGIAAANVFPPWLGAYIAPYTSGSTTTLNWKTACSTSTLSFVQSFTGVKVTASQMFTALASLGYSDWIGPELTASCTNSDTLTARVAGVVIKTMLSLRPASATFDASSCKPYTAAINDPKKAGNFYASGACGVLSVTDLGTIVTPLKKGMPANVAANALAIVPAGTKLYAATGHGVYKYGGLK
jgi:photosystem II stability/assembly factor-like uncharacterized protein